jgi:hypothetical protein
MQHGFTKPYEYLDHNLITFYLARVTTLDGKPGESQLSALLSLLPALIVWHYVIESNGRWMM